MITLTKELTELGFGTSQSADIIRKAKAHMVKQGFSYYSSKRLGRVPVSSVEELLGINLSNLTKEEKTMPKISNIYQDKNLGNGIMSQI